MSLNTPLVTTSHRFFYEIPTVRAGAELGWKLTASAEAAFGISKTSVPVIACPGGVGAGGGWSVPKGALVY
jgi:hypothetical protein